MGGICSQNDNYWCPLASDSCNNIQKPCVLLVSADAGITTLKQMALVYVAKEGKVSLVSEQQKEAS